VPTVPLNGIEIYYEIGGQGPRLLFLNGSGATLESAAPFIDRLRQDFELAAHDQRGLGRTGAPDGPYTMADYAADAAAMLTHLGWETSRVIGVSFGGMVAQELAVTWPDRMERLALLCTSPGGEGGASYALHELEGLPADDRTAATVRLLDRRFTPEWLATHPVDQAIVARLSDRGPGSAGQLEARRHHDVWGRLPAITCPTFVGCGRYDSIAPVTNSEAIVQRIPHAELHVYEGGHLFFVQDPAAFPAVIDFLRAGA
jgi:pimeloyl-ACP methyl ester carboxylesterase